MQPRRVGALDRFLAEAAQRGVEVDVRRFPEGTRTAADAARAVDCNIGQIVKSLVFVADEHLVFVALTSGANRASTERLAELVGATSVRTANADEAHAATGFAIGGTPPFGYPSPLRVLVDEDLLQHDVVWAAAGTPDTVFPVAPAVLAAAARAEPAAFKDR
jgi:prolyl-tRNA editing enzyme YbaK/EbsC (Cys-tRNA(Pro) deacylase)